MKILLLIDFLGSGGAQRQFVGLAVMLKNKGYEVQTAGYFDDTFYLPYLQNNDVPYTYVKEAQPTKTRIWKMHRFIQSVKPDVVIAYLDTPCILACLSKLMGGKFKLIVSERNTTQRLTRTSRVKFFLYRWADAIVPNSFSQERFIEENYPHLSAKVQTITNFIDTDIFQPKMYETNDILRMICVGRINPQKNIPNLLRALNIITKKGVKLKVDWFGRCDNEASRIEMNSLVTEYKLQDVFEIHDQTSNIVEEYNKADFFCLPSLYEGFPNVLCEAMCCGLPVVCSRVCDNPNIVKEGINGFMFDPHNIEEMAMSISNMIELKEEERIEMRNINRKKVLNICSKESFIDKYMSLL